ncbi:family 1 glycosylhydrolase [Microbacterium sp.]|uniref:family 1 glycosylhydrolase n=1 Tax=Microbacterium sp. TaxID=51671 RepID=UPI002E356885|nr:family 1 glycosylhydrolase [Microbacterium sp.]HEX5729426.1 family 1 glycosylhydrolase [Microbacterium sp.]
MIHDARTAPEIWGGIECTLNRVGDRHHSQLASSGHLDRIESDLDQIASLGLSALRYPVLWDQVEQPGGLDFAYADRAMSWFRGEAMRPIVGLLHHGSGPLSTSLADPAMPERFAGFAASVARRHPWVSDYTPINEPLTTARFSGLYGHWYPHALDDRSFVRMLLTQTRATVLAMRAIRDINPAARLIQTEDLGRASGTRRVLEQVEFENARRWLSFDLLCGSVVPGHHLYDYLTGLGGAEARELEWFTSNSCPPDVLGINHYPRSNRWLDHRVGLYDVSTRGGNTTVQYADVATCDFPFAASPTLSSLIEEAWHRYRIPVALTEVHIHAESAQRIAWWSHAVAAATESMHRGADVRAVTTWSLLGSFDWDTLCTSVDDRVTYERGAFDISSGARLETPLAAAVRQTTGAVLAARQVA